MESEKFILTDKPHSTIRKKGFPLDSLSIDIKTNQYYYDLEEGRWLSRMEKNFNRNGDADGAKCKYYHRLRRNKNCFD